MRTNDVATLQTVERALNFLEVVAASPHPLTIKDVAQEIGVNITTCYHIFNTLLAGGYIERGTDQKLRIGFKSAVLYDAYRRGFSTQKQMNDFVTELAEMTCETAFISTLLNDSVVLTAFADGRQALRATGLFVGLTGLEHVRSSGRAVLAFLDEATRARVIERSLAGIAPSQHEAIKEDLAQTLERVRERGWALDNEEYNAGIVGIAAPFFNEGGRVVGAVGIWVPAQRATSEVDALAKTVVEAAQRATVILGRHY